MSAPGTNLASFSLPCKTPARSWQGPSRNHREQLARKHTPIAHRVGPDLDELKETCPAHKKRRSRTSPGKPGRPAARPSCKLSSVGRCWTISDGPGQPAWCPHEGDDGVPDEELTEQLNRLRARAGTPSVRELAKLTKRQGPGRAMSRSTVHDKLSGRTPPRLGQVLTLVQACADYAKSIGAPLPADDTDEQVWREWTQAALARTPLPVPADVTASALPVPGDRDASPSPRWDLDPLIRAGMDDMVDLVQVGEREPMADWLPTLAEALREAGMSNEQFLLAASKEHPQDIVSTLLALASDLRQSVTRRLPGLRVH